MRRFYEHSPERVLRFGDVIRGFQFATPQTHTPSLETQKDWDIAVSVPEYAAVMTPCCSIEGKAIALAPLVQIRPGFLNNEHLAEDLTRINEKVAPEQSIASHSWETLPPERRQSLIAKGPSYVFIDCFIYQAHDLLRRYVLHCKSGQIEVGQYMVDLKSICRVDCNLVNRDSPAPPGTKILQLSVATREAMRNKLSHYYGRAAEEDLAYRGP